MTKHEQSSGQTVREILREHGIVRLACAEEPECDPIETIEDSLNAHIVSALEGLKKQQVPQFDTGLAWVKVDVIDAAIAAHKRETK